ncbi:Major Facilitator Superfamily [Popillia japonica]|uniref:Major Facilitator Superfamily n=1 Tax=Popillia japonica TaxID=7064 RepID=A0AAW1IT81_POPJA
MGCNILKCTCGKTRFFPQRYVIAILCLAGILVGYGHRVSLTLAITVMTNVSVSRSTSCPPRNATVAAKQNLSGGVIDWSNREQNLVLGAFYPGYLIGHLPVGILSDQYGGRWVFGIGLFISTVITLATHIVVIKFPYWATMILRNIMGLGQSVIYVAISTIYAKWIPKEERSIIGGFSFAANSLGMIFGNLITGMVINLAGNWPIAFYMWGILGIIWCVFFLIYGYSEPETSPVITDKEKEFLQENIVHGHRPKIPWLGFATDIGIWALVISEIGHDFTIFTLINNFPKYLSDVLQYDLGDNAILSSMPYVAQWVGGVIAGQVTDYLIKKKNYDVLLCRKVGSTLGIAVPSTFVLIAGYMGCNGTLVILMFTLYLLFKGVMYSAMKVNHLDMTIHFAGILMALSNGIGALTGYVSPEVISAVAPDNTLEQWLIVFWIVWAVAFACNLFYIFFARASRRKWDYSPEEMDQYEKDEQARKSEKEQKKLEKARRKEERKNKRNEAGPST